MNAFCRFPMLGLCAVFLGGCADRDQWVESSAITGRWNFPVVGQLESISVADLSIVVRLVAPRPVYRLVVVSANRVELQRTKTYRGSSHWVVVERVHDRWRVTEGDMFIVS